MIDKDMNNSVFLIITLILLGVVPLNLQAGGADDTTVIQQQNQPELDSYEASLTAAQLRQHQSLMKAIYDDDIEAARTALAGGYILPNRGTTVSSRSPLFEAGSIGRPEFVSLLLESGANPQVMVRVIDSIRGSIEYIAHALYISIRAQRNYAEKGEEYPLDATRDEKLTECLRLFLEAGADPNILSKSKVVSDDEYGAMQWMAAIGNTEAMALLHQYGGDVNLPTYGSSSNPFSVAYRKDHYEAIEWLLDHGLDIYQEDENGNRPVDESNIKIVKIFLERELVNPVKQRYLSLAIAKDDFDLADQLLSMGVEVNRMYLRFKHGWSDGFPLYFAIFKHKPEWVEYLLKEGADPCLVTLDGDSAYKEINRQMKLKTRNSEILNKRHQILAFLEQYKPESECQK